MAEPLTIIPCGPWKSVRFFAAPARRAGVSCHNKNRRASTKPELYPVHVPPAQAVTIGDCRSSLQWGLRKPRSFAAHNNFPISDTKSLWCSGVNLDRLRRQKFEKGSIFTAPLSRAKKHMAVNWLGL
ncbi:hypothetical protein PoB_001091800 [Plakobranchus ocellatus]|uniref:Uncharacterized protein n=1 Tax=Plakobranchus ocellatus TaxID=259542 RepID=A0AAV3YQ83_9GAST|nr:hypothetical protein PoB_001091800 [Plakobranchus ocellatus]